MALIVIDSTSPIHFTYNFAVLQVVNARFLSTGNQNPYISYEKLISNLLTLSMIDILSRK